MNPNRARRILRGWPFKGGQSELKRLLSVFLPQQIGAIDIVPGLRLFLATYQQSGRIFWWFEEIEAALQFYIAHFLPSEGRVIDVGAQSGLLGMWAARHKSCEAILIEADAEAQGCIERSLHLNPGLRGLCTLVKAACSDVFDPRFPDQENVRLDSLLEERGWDHVDLIKIDTDGHEHQVLRSLGHCLRSDAIDAVFIEMSGKERQLFAVLETSGFVAYGVRRTRLPDLRSLGRNEVEGYWFSRVNGPLTHGSPFENFLWVADGGRVHRHLERWCQPFTPPPAGGHQT